MFKNMKISTQLALGFGTVLCSAAVLALCGFVALASVLGGFRVVTTDVWPKIDLANQSKAAKLATTNNTGNNNLINGSLTNR